MPLYIPHSEGKQHEISENGNKAKSAQMLTFTKLPYQSILIRKKNKKQTKKPQQNNKIYHNWNTDQ